MTLVRPAHSSDAEALCAIYNPYVTGSCVSFEEQPVTAAEMRRRLAEVSAVLPWLVYETSEGLLGYAYANRWRVRSAYRYSVESTVYVDARWHRRGVGRSLYAELLAELRKRGLRQVIGGIALPNESSVALHEALGFRKVAQFEKVGYKLGQWIDVGYWQLSLGEISG